MSDLKIDVEVTLTCACGNALDDGVEVTGSRSTRGHHEIVVEPCARCLEKAHEEEAEGLKEAHEVEVEALQERITELESRPVADPPTLREILRLT